MAIFPFLVNSSPTAMAAEVTGAVETVEEMAAVLTHLKLAAADHPKAAVAAPVAVMAAPVAAAPAVHEVAHTSRENPVLAARNSIFISTT